MELEYVLPGDIEKRSFEIIDSELEAMGIHLPDEQKSVTMRTIHTSADFEYAYTLKFTQDAVEKAKDLIKSGADIVTDTNMALAGISKKTLERFGGRAHCFMADEDVAAEAKERCVTRAYVSMEKAAKTIDKPVIFAVGNAPTALVSLYDMMQRGIYRPAFVIGVPVGFVNVVKSKELIIESGVDSIVNVGRKGGSSIAAAICNALLYSCIGNIEEIPYTGKALREDATGAQLKFASLRLPAPARKESRCDSLFSEMRYGFTTGSAATAASAAAAYMLLGGHEKNDIVITTPKGIDYHAEIVEIERHERRVKCAVVKDGGDDPDITTGTLIFSELEIISDEEDVLKLELDGGVGVGRVTKPGLDRPVGEAAINRVPRQMIISEVSRICKIFDFNGRIRITISVPDGEELAKHTFNPRLGIVGGISILGTSGIVEPMSMQALLDTIDVELSVKKAEGRKIAVIAPGNYGQEFMKKTYHYEIDDAVKCSNFVGDTIDMAVKKGFEGILLLGAIGKLVKLAGGILNTHSSNADCRMELLTAAAIRKGADIETARRLLECVTTEDAIRVLIENNLKEPVMQELMERIMDTLQRKAKDRIKVECIVYSTEFGELAKSSGASDYLRMR